MPRKNKEEYNDYMRNYMKKKNRENRGQPALEGDFDPSASTDGKPTLNINKAGDLIKQTQDLLKSKGTPDQEDDPILKAIDKYGKYIPLAMKFFEGMKGSVNHFNQQDQTPKLQAPNGWLNATPMQKLGWKYTRADWTAAGEAYDAAVEQSGYTNPQINNNYVDPTYSAPQDLRALARKYPEAPLVNEAPQTQQETAVTPSERQPLEKSSPEKSEDKGEIKSKPVEDHSQTDQLVSELQQDNLKYINMGAEFINGLKDQEFEDHLKNIDELVEKAKPFMSLIPIHVKGMIIQTSKEDLQKLFKEKCPDKFKILEKENSTKKILDLFEALKKIISEDK